MTHYLEEVDHIAERLGKLEAAIDEAVKQAPGGSSLIIINRHLAHGRTPPFPIIIEKRFPPK
jgi:hypothetical protein